MLKGLFNKAQRECTDCVHNDISKVHGFLEDIDFLLSSLTNKQFPSLSDYMAAKKGGVISDELAEKIRLEVERFYFLEQRYDYFQKCHNKHRESFSLYSGGWANLIYTAEGILKSISLANEQGIIYKQLLDKLGKE